MDRASSSGYIYEAGSWHEMTTTSDVASGSGFLAILGGILIIIAGFPWRKDFETKREPLFDKIWICIAAAILMALAIVMGININWVLGVIGIIISAVYCIIAAVVVLIDKKE